MYLILNHERTDKIRSCHEISDKLHSPMAQIEKVHIIGNPCARSVGSHQP